MTTDITTLHVKEITTDKGVRYQVWNKSEPVSYIFEKLSAAVRLMRRMKS